MGWKQFQSTPLTLLVTIECTKEGVKFSANGDIGNGAVTLRPHTDVDKPKNNVEVSLTEPVSLTFSLKYLINFCKATGLSEQVELSLSSEVPLLVDYDLGNNTGFLRFYLAPKVRMRLHIFNTQALIGGLDRRRGIVVATFCCSNVWGTGMGDAYGYERTSMST
jgi:hypothetical protein